MRVPVTIIALALAACRSNVGVPAFDRTWPPPLPRVAGASAAPEAAAVRVEMRPLPWWTIAGTETHFILKLSESAAPPTVGTRLGPVRSHDVALSDELFGAVRCAWQIVPMGEPRPCAGPREAAMARALEPIERARAELRELGAAGGATVVGEVRCFAASGRGGGRLWCEGTALAEVGGAPRAASAGAALDPAAPDPAEPVPGEPATPPTRFVLAADGSVAMLGDVPVVGTTLALRYRPVELGLYILDLGRDGTQRGLVGVGVTALVRKSLGGTRADAIAGVSALAVAPNGSVNPRFEGLYHGFAGLAYQTPWRISGVAQPFVQLRAGAARGTDLAPSLAPMVELRLGLSTPERRR